MILLDSFDPYTNFWETNPQLRILFHKEFDSAVPSKVMWALFLYAHPSSKFFEEPPTTRLSLIKNDFLQDPSFEINDYSETLSLIYEHTLTKAQRSLSIWERKLHERDELISSIPYTLDNFEQVDKLVTNSQKLWDQYIKIQEALTKEQEGKTEGDIEESLSEKGVI